MGCQDGVYDAPCDPSGIIVLRQLFAKLAQGHVTINVIGENTNMAKIDLQERQPATPLVTKVAPEDPAKPTGDKEVAATAQNFGIYDALLLGMVVIWAANPAAIKWALQYMDPLSFNALRFLLATLLPVGILLASREGWRWDKGDGVKIFLMGLIGHGIYQAVFIIA